MKWLQRRKGAIVLEEESVDWNKLRFLIKMIVLINELVVIRKCRFYKQKKSNQQNEQISLI